MTGARSLVAHVDLDCFFASVEELDDPGLVGSPVVVGGLGPRGVVATANYAARGFGIHSAMPMAQARKLCPEAHFIEGRHARYRELSAAVMVILARHCVTLEQVSTDEAYLDVGDVDDPHGWVRSVRDEVRSELGLVASVGAGSSKLVAKVASGAAKPDGAIVVAPGDEASFLAPLPVGVIPGVGPVSADKLADVGVTHIWQLADTDPVMLAELFGDRTTAWLLECAVGNDTRPVVGEHGAKQISVETTFTTDLVAGAELADELAKLAETVTTRLHRHGGGARTVTVKLRWSDFETVTRSVTLRSGTDNVGDVLAAVNQLAKALLAPQRRRKVRLVGVALSGLTPADQGSLFDGPPWSGRGSPPAGAAVSHATFGRGRVWWSAPAIVRVRFDDGRVRTLEMPTARLVPADFAAFDANRSLRSDD